MSKYVPLSLLWPGVYSSYIVMQHLLLWMQRGVGKHRGRRGDIGLQVSTYHCLCFGLVFILLTYVCTYVPLILVTYICKYVPLSCFDLAWCQLLQTRWQQTQRKEGRYRWVSKYVPLSLLRPGVYSSYIICKYLPLSCFGPAWC